VFRVTFQMRPAAEGAWRGRSMVMGGILCR
jgi:hypothetical protein